MKSIAPSYPVSNLPSEVQFSRLHVWGPGDFSFSQRVRLPDDTYRIGCVVSE